MVAQVMQVTPMVAQVTQVTLVIGVNFRTYFSSVYYHYFRGKVLKPHR